MQSQSSKSWVDISQRWNSYLPQVFWKKEMRKIVVEFVVPEEHEEAYSDVHPELVIEDFLGQPLRVISDMTGEENQDVQRNNTQHG